MVVLLLVLGPLGVDVHVGLHGLGEVHLVGGLLLVGVAGVVSVPVPAVEGVALAGGGHGLAHDAVGVGEALLGGLAGGELAAVSDVRHGMVVLVCVLFPCSKPAACLGGRRIEPVILLIVFRDTVHVGQRVPTLEGIACVGRRRSVNASTFVSHDGCTDAAIGELPTICRENKFSLGRLLGSSALTILIGIIGQCYCRHATKSERQT